MKGWKQRVAGSVVAMSARSGGNSEPEREERHTRQTPDLACNEVPAERAESHTRRVSDAACNEITASDRRGQSIARLATSQRGPIGVGQLADEGVGHSAVTRRVTGGSLHRVFRGVYLVGHEALAPFARESAALLACGELAVVSHSSAASAWRFAREPLEVHVTVVGRRRRSRPGLRAHYAARLDPRDLRWIDGVPLTSPARTLLDLAATRYPDLERAFADAHAQRLLKPYDLVAAIKSAGPRRGVRALRALISDNETGFTRSKAERLLRRLIREANLPEPRFNVPFRQYELDAVWPEHRLVLEVDGYNYHGHRAQFESDRARDMALMAAGYRVIRVTWRQLSDEPLAVVAAIATALGRGRPPG
jgi:very-short-patch-repair endonuclease